MKESSAQHEQRFSQSFLNAKKEAWIIILAWFVCLVWTVGYAGLAGYQNGGDVSLVLGMPAWIVWGVMLPWFSATVFSVLFSLFYIKEDILE